MESFHHVFRMLRCERTSVTLASTAIISSFLNATRKQAKQQVGWKKVHVSELPDVVRAAVVSFLPVKDVLGFSACSQSCLEQFSGKDILTAYLQSHSIPLNGYLPMDAYRRHLFEIPSFVQLQELPLFRLIHLERLRCILVGLSSVDKEVVMATAVFVRALEDADLGDPRQRECIEDLLEQVRKKSSSGVLDESHIQVVDNAFQQSLQLFDIVKEIQEDTIKHLEMQCNDQIATTF